MIVKIHKILNEKERNQLVSLIEKYRYIFATNPNELGCCTAYEHRIDVGDSRPVNIPPYKVSPEKRKILNNLVQELLEIGVIEPSRSPYSAPCACKEIYR